MDATLWLWVAIAAGVLAVLYGVFSMRLILRLPAGTARMQEIAAAIQTGAKAYLNRQYSTILVVGVALLVVMGFSPLGWPTAGGMPSSAWHSAARSSRSSRASAVASSPRGRTSARTWWARSKRGSPRTTRATPR